MKRALSILIIAVICLSLCSCGKSEAATNADNMILEIGEVTLESGDKIADAEEAISNLKESEYKQLEQISILEEARATYDRLVEEKRIADNNKAISEIETAIDSIGVVTLEQESVITSVRFLYNKGNDDVKAGIKNYEILEQAEAELSNLKVQNVINLIDQIGQVTLNSGEKIDAAKAAYNALTTDEKGHVTNSANIVAASTKLAELKEQEKERALQQTLSSLQTETDKVEGITWYKPSTYPYYANSRSYVLPYIGQRDSSTWLRLKFHYTGDNWLFFEKITISIDGENYYKTYSYYDVERDNGSGNVWEWVDISPTNADIEMLKKIANSKETIVRFQGDNYHYDLTVRSSDKTAINQVLTAYEALKNS